MITINLLPKDFREREKTPIRIFIATVAAAALVAGTGGTYAYLHFGQLASEEQSLARLNDDRQALEPQLKHHSALTGEIADKEKWQQAIRDLRNNRIPWSRKIDQLIDLVSQSGDQNRYLVWFTDLNITQTVDGKASGGTLSGKGMSAGDDVGKVALLFGDVRRHEFAKGFATISEPEGKVAEGSNSSNSNVVEFPITLGIAARDPKKLDPKKNPDEVKTDVKGDAKPTDPQTPNKPEAGK
jgi:Tfp pilus assembly protein PilN